MRPRSITIRPLVDAAVLAELATDAEANGWRMVSRLIVEWADGSNRFTAPGERAYVAVSVDERPIAVGGLNVDPFAEDLTVGRIRRLYVARGQRRKGVASALMETLMDDAAGHFRMVHLRTDSPEAAAFYEAIGFARVAGDPNCTHRRRVVA
jgi:GNAT superfamily N-acetyltransferase